jgi:hypothetical protein
MSAITGDTLATYGGTLRNYSPVKDPTTDLDASMGNKAMAATSDMTQTAARAWVSLTVNGTTTPTLVAWAALWALGTPSAPVLAYSGTPGQFTITFPANVSDQIQSGQAGYTGPQALNLRSGWGNLRWAGTQFDINVTVTSANVATISIANVSGSLANPGSVTGFDVFVF